MPNRKDLLKFVAVFLLAFVANLVWENLHSFFYTNYRGGEITEFILIRAALTDAVFITLLGVFFYRSAFLRKRLWLSFVIGFIFAVGLEIFALNTGRWAYASTMPIIPILGVGLTPSIQLGLLSYFIFKFIFRDK